MSILIVIPFFIGFFVESILGFAGLIVSYTIAGFFFDIKDMIFVGVVLGFFSALFILMTDLRKVDFKTFGKIILYNTPTMLIGVYLVDVLHSDILFKIFAIMLMFFAYQIYFGISLSSKLQKLYIGFGGLINGVFGTGGPIIIASTKQDFSSKSHLRATFALFFLVADIIKIVQFQIQGTFDFFTFTPLWWAPIVMFGFTYLGFKIHKIMSEEFFKKALSIMLVISSIIFLLK